MIFTPLSLILGCATHINRASRYHLQVLNCIIFIYLYLNEWIFPIANMMHTRSYLWSVVWQLNVKPLNPELISEYIHLKIQALFWSSINHSHGGLILCSLFINMALHGSQCFRFPIGALIYRCLISLILPESFIHIDTAYFWLVQILTWVHVIFVGAFVITGSKHGLSLIINLEQYEYMRGPHDDAGAKVNAN